MDVLGLIELPGYVIFPLIICILLFFYTRISFNYWRKQGIPTLTPLPFIGTQWTFFVKKHFYEYDMAMYKKHNKRFGAYEFGSDIFFTGDPEDLKNILVKDFDVFANRRHFESGKDSILDLSVGNLKDEEWQQTRNIMSPLFTGSKLRKMNERVAECGRVLQRCLAKIEANEKEFDAQSLFGAYSMDVIASVAFKTNTNSMENPNNKFVEHAKGLFNPPLTTMLAMAIPKLKTIFRAPFIREKNVAFFKGVLKKVFEMRADEDKPSTDFIALLREHIKETHGDDFAMTEDKMLAQCVAFFLAGYDTTSTVIVMAAYNMAVYPDYQRRLQQEIDESVEKHGGLTYDAISEMSFLNAVVKETLRMYGPATRGEREVSRDYQLGDVFLKKGTYVAFPIYAIHYDPELWPDPHTFKPDRFLGGQKEIGTFSYMPFLTGRRNCIAMRLAIVEVKMAIASCLQNHTLIKTKRLKFPPETKGSFIVMPKNAFLGVEKRSKS